MTSFLFKLEYLHPLVHKLSQMLAKLQYSRFSHHPHYHTKVVLSKSFRMQLASSNLILFDFSAFIFTVDYFLIFKILFSKYSPLGFLNTFFPCISLVTESLLCKIILQALSVETFSTLDYFIHTHNFGYPLQANESFSSMDLTF